MTFRSPKNDDFVKRINIGYIYNLNERLHPLTKWNGEQNRLDVFSAALSVRSLLEELFNSFGNFYGLRSSQPSANRLYGLLEQYTNPPPELLGTNVSAIEISAISQVASAFETALVEEFGVLPCYLVTPKGGYSLDVLTNTPQDLFPDDLLKIVPDAKYDVEQAAKCLAFEVPTAAAFHLHRINEAVLHVYWDVVTKNATRPEQSSMGVYLAALKKKKKGDKKTLATLQQIKDLHRNPISHPDENLSVDDAIELNGIIRSAISRMLAIIRKQSADSAKKAPKTLQEASVTPSRVA